MERLKVALIREEFVAITGDRDEAIILNQFLYWSQRVSDFDKFLSEENSIQEKLYYIRTHGIEDNPPKIELRHGWIFKKALEIKDEVMSTDSEKTINRQIINLVEKGFLDRRRNPNYGYDRTYQYRVNLPNIIEALFHKGYVLQEYKIDMNIYKNLFSEMETTKRQNDARQASKQDLCKRQIDASKGQIDASKSQNDASKGQIDGALPESTNIDYSQRIHTENNILPDLQSGENNPCMDDENKTEKQPKAENQFSDEEEPVHAEVLTKYDEIFIHWNSKRLIKHKILDKSKKDAIGRALKNGYTIDEIKDAIDNYDFILANDNYYLTYRWSLEKFLNHNLDQFRELESVKQSYKKYKSGQQGLTLNDTIDYVKKLEREEQQSTGTIGMSSMELFNSL